MAYFKPKYSSVLFEELEPRLLFSADGVEALAAEVVVQELSEEPVIIADLEPVAEADANDASVDQPVKSETASTIDHSEEDGTSTAENDAPEETTPQETDSTDNLSDAQQDISADATIPTTENSPDSSEDGTTTTLDNETISKELVLINNSVKDHEQLVDAIVLTDDINRSFEVFILDDEQDGIEQVSSILSGTRDLDAIHIITHGKEGSLALGSDWLDSDDLLANKDAVIAWGDALTDNGDILLYGCNIASDDSNSLTTTLAALTDADVASSDDVTGHTNLSGDWQLEYTSGDIETEIALDSIAQEEWRATLAPDAGYGIFSNTSATPRFTYWTGSSFVIDGDTDTLNDYYRIIQGADAPTRDEKIVVGVDAADLVVGEMWNGSGWNMLSLGKLGDVSESYWYGADVAYEQQSGDAVIVWNINSNIAGEKLNYAVWDGSSWTTPTSISAYAGSEPQNMRLAFDPGSDTMALVVNDANADDYVLIWDGSAWGNALLLDNSGTLENDQSAISVAFEAQTGNAMVMYGKDADTDVYYRIWDGSIWADEASLSAATGVTGEARWITSATDMTSDRIAIGVTTSANEAWVGIWNGSGWETPLEAGTATTGLIYPNLAIGFESTTGHALATYGQGSETSFRYRTWNSASGWSSEQTGTDLGAVSNSMTLDSSPASDQLMLSVQDANSELHYLAWNGSGWSADNILSKNTGEIKNQPFVFIYDQDGMLVEPNNAPTTTGIMDFSVDEDAGFSYIDLHAIFDDAEDADSALVYSIENNTNTSLFDATSINGSGVLALDYAADQNGTANITIRATDTGGLFAESTFTVTVIPVNDAPVIEHNAGLHLTTISEDPTVNNGDLISAILSSSTDGPDSVSDVDSGAVEGIAIFSLSNSNGTWEYDTGSGWTPVGSVSVANSLLLRDTDSLRFVPNAEWNGTELMTFAAWDQTSGTAGTKVDTSVYGGTTAFSSGIVTPSITVNGVNDDPTVTDLIGDALTYTEGDGVVVIEQGGDAIVSDIDSADFAGGSLNLEVDSGLVDTEDVFSIRNQGSAAGQIGVSGSDITYGGTVIGTYTGGSGLAPLNVSFNADATAEAVTALVRNLTYENIDNDTPTSGSRSVTIDIYDGDGGASQTQNLTINVVAVNDPSIVDLNGINGAGNDFAVTFTEDGGAVNVADSDAVILDVDDTSFQYLGINLFNMSDTADEQIVIAGYTFSYGTGDVVTRTVGSTEFEIDFDATGFSIVRFGGGLIPQADLQILLRGITYENVSQNPTAGNRTFQITAEDASGPVGPVATSTISVNPVNDAPTATITASSFGVNEDDAYRLLFGFSVADADAGSNEVAVTLSVNNGVLNLTDTTGLTYTGGANNSAAMTFTGTITDINTALTTTTYRPDADFAGTDTVTLFVNDQGNSGGPAQTASDSASIIVAPFNDAPVVTAPGSALLATEQVNLAVQGTGFGVSDVDENGSGATATLSVGEGTLTIVEGDSGVVIDSGNGSDTITVSGTIAQINNLLTGSATGTITYLNNSDAPSGSTTISVSVNDQGNTGTDPGLSGDGSSEEGTASQTINITSINDPPVLETIGDKTVDELATLIFTASATDSDIPADTLTFSLDAASIAAGMTIDANTGDFTWTPTEGQDGTHSVTVTVTDDGTGTLSDSETFTITVNDINSAPVLAAIGDQTVDELVTLNFTASSTDSDIPTDTLTFSLDATSLAAGMTIDANTGDFSWAPTEGQDGPHSVTVTVIDDGTGTLSDSETFTITVNDINSAPVLAAIGDQSVDELATLTFTATATDSDIPADTLTYSLDATSIAAGMTIDANTGVFSWTPAEDQDGTHSATVTVTDDGTGTLADSETFAITVNDINSAPVLAAIGDQSVDELATLTITATATDNDIPANTLSFSLDATSLAAGMTINANTGDFSWTPTEGQDGVHSVTVTVTDDGTGTLSDSETFTITVNDINNAPVLAAIGDQAVDELATLTFTAAATDSDIPADTLTFSLDATSIAAGMTIDANTGDFSWTPTEGQDGSHSVTVTVTDDGTGTLSDSETFTITVNDINSAPVLAAIGDQTVDELATLTFTASATDSDIPADTLTFSLDATSLAAGMTIDANTGDFSWTPSEGQDGVHSVTVTVTDDGTATLGDSETFTITVNDINSAPVLAAIGDQTVDELATLTFTAAATDSDIPADTLTFSLDATSLAAGMTIDANTGDFSWTPTEGQDGVHSVTVTVTDDGTGTLADSETFTITVNDINSPPVLAAIGDQSVDELATLTFTASATDSDIPADILTFSLDATSLAAGMTIDANTGDFSWTPAEDQDGAHTVTVTVTDDGTGTPNDSETFTIIVNDINSAPVLAAIGNQTVDELATLTFTASATDSDIPADTLTFSLDATSLAAGMTIDANTGDFSWTPTEGQDGVHSVTVTVTDDGTGTLGDSETFTITVNDINSAPVLAAIGDQTVDELATLNFTASATDSDIPADTLTFSLDATSIAAGMTIDANTGDFSWIPAEGQDGPHSVTVTVTDDGTGTLSDSETFTITVNNINSAPVLAAIGNQTVDELATLTLTAAATDSDIPADTLTFSLDATSIAAGMTIDANTGDFSWTPAEDQDGSQSVTITVTDDGTGTLADSETFTITVNDINSAPVLAAIGDQTVDELATLTFTATATDIDIPANTLSFRLDATSIAAGMTIDANTGDFSWTPTEAQDGPHSLTITVTDDGTGTLSDIETFTITVNDINNAPVFAAIGDQTVDELATLTFTAAATDSDIPVDTLTFSLVATSIAAGMTIDANTGDFSWTPTEAQDGLHSVTVTVTDDGIGTLADSETFTITVNDINSAPVLTAIGNQTVDELATLTFTATAIDSDIPADTLTFSLDATSLAAGMTIDANTGGFSWTPTEGQDGSHSVTITVTDDGTGTLSDSENFTITVNDINSSPLLAAIGNQTVDELATLAFTAPATDSDLPADTLTFSLDATSLAAGMTINANTGDFSWTPTEGQDGVHSVTVTVTDDGTGTLSDSETFTITVNDINNAPVLAAIGDQTVDELATLIFTAAATDSDIPADTLTFSLDATSIAAGMTIDANTGDFSWTPTESQDGPHSVTVTVTDDGTGTLTDSETFTINVNEINNAPVLAAIGNQTVDELAILTFTATAIDSDLPSNTLTFSLDATSLAAGMSITAGGDFSWTPTELQGGLTPDVTITVTDSGTGNLIDSETFTITVNDVNVAPVLAAIGNQTVDELVTLSFTATATDSDLPADTLTFSLDAASEALGMTITAGGDFSWTPTELQGGLTPDVTITVTDNGTGNLVDSETFTITVGGTNTAPVLDPIGNQTVDELATLSFTATATDSDLPADTLTFSLDAASEALGMTITAGGDFSWTPTELQGGLAPDVTITVTDNGTGTLVDSETFTITVNDINVAPVLDPIGDKAVDELTTLSFTATATDSDLPADTLTFSLDAASEALGMTITAGGDFSWTPTELQGGLTPDVTITVTDSGTGNLIDSETFTITVNDVNVAPVLAAIGNQTVDELATLSFTATATDSDLPADTLTFSLDAASEALGMTITAGGDFSWTPTELQGGLTPDVTITVTDSGTGSLVDSETFTITVNDINVAPVLAAIGNQTVDELATLSFTATATDSDLPADTLTFSLDAASEALGMTITAGGDFSWTPTELQGGLTPDVTITVTDSGTGNLIDSETFTITVNDVNVAPVLAAIGNQTVDELATLSFTATATDSDLPADTLTFSLDAASEALGMTITAGGDFSWTPTELQGGLAPDVTITVIDNGTGTLVDSETFTITVNDVNVAPVLAAIGNQTVDELATLSFTATATDSDLPADTLTFSLDAASEALGMTITAGGDFSWTPTEIQGGLAPDVTITVTDNGTGNLIDSETFTITVNDINVAPVLDPIGDKAVDELATLSFTAIATDSDLPADNLTFSLDAASEALGMTITAGGDFLWTPTEAQGGLTPDVTITVTDNGTGNLVDSETFTITVGGTNTAPVLDPIGNQTVDELATLSFTATATDSDLPADTLTFSLDAASEALGMTITAGGDFSWTPTEIQGGLTPDVTITVTDNGTGNLVDSETFTITVNDINVAPVLAAIGDQTVDELATLSFTATATDADIPADTLTFSLDATSIAAGMTIDANTGDFSWTPTELQGGLTPDVTITVTDNGTGNLVDSETFTITVNEINVAPVLAAIGDQTVDELATLSFTATATDSDLPAGTLTFSLDAASEALGMTITAGGDFSWTPTELQGGLAPDVTITVTDNGTGTLVDSETFTITVNDVNVAPVLAAIGNQTVDELATLNFTASATDDDLPANTLTYSLDATSIAAGMTIDANTGDFAWTPTEGQDGAHSVTVTVTDDGTGTLTDPETFTINVNEINNNDPIAIDDSITVDEGSTITTLDGGATSVLANDTDADLPNDSLTVSLNTNVSHGSLALNADGTFSYTHDGSENFSDSFTYIVSDANGGVTDTGTVSITINPVNDNNPVATDDSITVDEGSTITTLDGGATSVLDNDIDTDLPNDSLTVALGIGPGNGVLTLNSDGTFSYTHDGNENFSDAFTYIVTDADGGITDTGIVSITINPINDNAPVINAGQTFSVSESASSGFSLGNAVATDVDTGTTLSGWTISGGNVDGIFDIDAATGEITVLDNTNLDFDTTPSYTLSLTVSDGTNTSAVETLTINVSDIATAITAGQSFSIAETDPNGTIVGTVATTGDTPKTFSITFGNVGTAFTIDNSGIITIADSSAIDFETLNLYTLTIQASDGTTPVTETVTITVTDVNENTVGPISDSDGSADSVAENANIGDTVGITALATDPDGTDTVTYSLTDDAGGLFAIDTNSGVVTVNGALDAELATSHTITVQALSTDGSTSSVDLTISVTDIDESDVGPISDLDALMEIVSEDLLVGSTVGITASATDADVDDDVTYSLSNDAGGLFAIDPNSGVVTLANPLDYETGTSHTITVLATSDDTSTSSRNFTVSVTDVNENSVGPVADTNGAVDTVAEDALVGDTVGITALATDLDGTDTVTYSLTDNAGGRFAIDVISGTITVANPLDFETASSHSVTVLATSSDTSTSSQTFTITLSDVNEFAVSPVTDNDGSLNSVAENSAAGTTVGLSVLATDADGTDTVTYSLSDDAGGRFTIDSTTGVITVAGPLDFESAVNHSITVLATSSDTSTSSQSFSITISNIDESSGTDPDPDTTTDPDPDPTPDPDPIPDPEPDPDPVDDPPPDEEIITDPNNTEDPDDTYVPPTPEIDTIPGDDDIPVDDNPVENVAVRILNSPDVDKIVDTSSAAESTVESEEQYLGYIAAESAQLVPHTQESGELKKQVIKHNYTTVLLNSFRAALHEASEFLISPLSAAPIYLDSVDMSSIVENPTIQRQLDILHQEMDESFKQSAEEQKTVVYAVSGVSATFAAGVVSYLLRAGSLMTSFLATMPIWKGFDPVSILVAINDKDKKDKKEKDISSPEERAKKTAETMFTDG